MTMCKYPEYRFVGHDVPRVDAASKVTGQGRYTADMKLPGMLHGKLLRSPVPHARIKHIDVSRAKALPGVKAVITGQDTPGIKYGNWRLVPISQDELPLAVDKVRFVGDEVAAVAAIDPDIAEEAIGLIRVEYEELPAMFDVDAALAENAPLIHDEVEQLTSNISLDRKIDVGDLESAFAQAEYIRKIISRCTRSVTPISSRAPVWPKRTATAGSRCIPARKLRISFNACWRLPWVYRKTTFE